MTPRETRAFLDRLDTIRSRVFMAATVAFCGYALIVEASRRPAEMARAFFWPSVIITGVIVLHFAVNRLVRRR